MGMHLMAAIDFAGIVSMIGIILKVAVGLGAVIFVHELGHFLAAKAFHHTAHYDSAIATWFGEKEADFPEFLMLDLAKVTKDDTVYDLGCGDGELLAHLQAAKGCTGYGIEIADAAGEMLVVRAIVSVDVVDRKSVV